MKNVLMFISITLGLLGLAVSICYFGYTKGVEKTKIEWELEKATIRAANEAKLIHLASQIEIHRSKQLEAATTLKKVLELHETIIAEQHLSYEQRLLQSANRAAIYQRQAEAGAVAQRNLASHAAKLDRALEEGIRLVGELQETLRLRDRQLEQLGKQILAERKLLEETL